MLFEEISKSEVPHTIFGALGDHLPLTAFGPKLVGEFVGTPGTSREIYKFVGLRHQGVLIHKSGLM